MVKTLTEQSQEVVFHEFEVEPRVQVNATTLRSGEELVTPINEKIKEANMEDQTCQLYSKDHHPK